MPWSDLSSAAVFGARNLRAVHFDGQMTWWTEWSRRQTEGQTFLLLPPIPGATREERTSSNLSYWMHIKPRSLSHSKAAWQPALLKQWQKATICMAHPWLQRVKSIRVVYCSFHNGMHCCSGASCLTALTTTAVSSALNICDNGKLSLLLRLKVTFHWHRSNP